MKIKQEQFDELNSLKRNNTEEFNQKLEELLGIKVVPTTVYRYCNKTLDICYANSEDNTVKELLYRMGVKIEK